MIEVKSEVQVDMQILSYISECGRERKKQKSHLFTAFDVYSPYVLADKNKLV